MSIDAIAKKENINQSPKTTTLAELQDAPMFPLLPKGEVRGISWTLIIYLGIGLIAYAVGWFFFFRL